MAYRGKQWLIVGHFEIDQVLKIQGASSTETSVFYGDGLAI